MRDSPTKGPEPLAYVNGRWLPLSQAAVSVFDTGFVQGVTVAEQLRTFRGQLFRLDQHLARLEHSLAIVGLDPRLPLTEMGQIATQLAEQNHKLLDAEDDQQVTIFVTPGIGPTYADVAPQNGPTVGVHTQPLAFHQWADKYEAGDSLVLTDVMQVPAHCWPLELKCRSRMHYFLADKQAREREPGARALLRDEQGHVTEASTANILIYDRRRGLVSPPKESILPGVTVAVIENLAAGINLPFEYAALSVEDVASAAEVLLLSTSPCVWPVTRLNGRPIADGRPGDVSRRLRAAWNEMVGLDIQAQAQRFAHTRGRA